MIRLLPPSPELVALGVREVIDRVLAEGGVEPPWIAVDDGGGKWVPLAAACRAAERARGVLVSSADAAFVAAHRLGIGGAAALPLSSTGLREALGAASLASLPAPIGGDPGMLEFLTDEPALKVVSFSKRAFWRAQLGERVLARLLAELARALEKPPAVLPWPALVLAEGNEARIREAWKPLASGPGKPAGDLAISDVLQSERGVAAAAYTALLEKAEYLGAAKAVASEPVHELPAGRLIGRWAVEPGLEDPDIWVAAPIDISGPKCRWRLSGGGTDAEIDDVLEVADLNRTERAPAVRVPGAVTGNLRPGTPGGLLVQRLADAAARRGIPLWVPNVDTEALRFVLRLPGTVWVDGPAVPR